MAQIILDEGAAPTTPASGKMAIYASNDATQALLKVVDSSGRVSALNPITNFSTSAQTPTATVRTYITGSAIAIPATKMQIGTLFRWRFNLTKTAAGSATSTFDIAIGTNGTTADSAIVSFTKPAGTAASDEGLVTIDAILRGPLSASAVMAGEFVLVHNLSATGHAQIPVVAVNTISSGFDATVANLIVGVCITSGASDVITIQQVSAQAWNL